MLQLTGSFTSVRQRQSLSVLILRMGAHQERQTADNLGRSASDGTTK